MTRTGATGAVLALAWVPPGHPIKMGDNPIGAIGVSGAPGGQFDDDGARAAIATIQDRMK